MTSKGFTILCNGCINKLIVQKEKIFESEYQKNFKIYPWHEERVTIECQKCGNETHFDEFED